MYYWILIVWLLCGLSGFFLYCLNKDIRPKKIHLLLFSFLTHISFGIVSLFYGYVVFSNRIR